MCNPTGRTEGLPTNRQMHKNRRTDRQTDLITVTRAMTDAEKVGMKEPSGYAIIIKIIQVRQLVDHVTVLANEVVMSGSSPPIISSSRPP